MTKQYFGKDYGGNPPANYERFIVPAIGAPVATDLVHLAALRPGERVLDIACGTGVVARLASQQVGAAGTVAGLDVNPGMLAVARAATPPDMPIGWHEASAEAMPFPDASFDGAYSMNVSMNIADKRGLYCEIRRVLKPGASLVLSEIAQGEGPEPDYPTPWAASTATSFLSTPEDTRQGLMDAGFEVRALRSTRDAALAFAARSRAMAERGEKPPHRAVALIHDELAPEAMANTARGLAESRLVPIEVFCTKAAA